MEGWQKIEDRRQESEDRSQKTEDRRLDGWRVRRLAEDRSQKTEDRRLEGWRVGRLAKHLHFQTSKLLKKGGSVEKDRSQKTESWKKQRAEDRKVG